MNNEERDQHLYRYPESNVLRNKFGILDHEDLQEVERLIVAERIAEGVPTGSLDLKHLQDIHHHLFQDVYAWAGELRQVDFHKTSWFHPYDRIEIGMADVHKRLSQDNFLRGLPPDDFAAQSAEYIGDVNRLHPFREGNGRTQFHYLKHLGQQAGHDIDLTRFDRETWIQASIEANDFKMGAMAKCIRRGMVQQVQTLDMDEIKREAQKHLTQEQDSQRHTNDQGEEL